MSGVIVGGWGYVAAAWGISLSLLVGYGIAVSASLGAARRKSGSITKSS